MLKKFFLVSTLFLFFGATYAEPNPNYKGPTYDLSKIQPELLLRIKSSAGSCGISVSFQKKNERSIRKPTN